MRESAPPQGFRLRSWLIVALVLALTTLPARAAVSADTAFYGLALFVGEQWRDDPIWHVSENFDWQELQIRPIAGKHRTERWDLWLEGNLTYIKLEDVQDSIELGVNVMTSYDALKYKGWRLFGELGVGVGWMSATPDTNLVGDSILGFLDYGFGVKFTTKQGYLFKLGPRFHHRSSLIAVDAGMNSYGLTVSVAK